jgi:hypothetical protein
MFTLPDNQDAVTTCPPISPPGPHPNGFFIDCGGGQGTIPTAEDFNELILNLRALLARASVPGVKGDATMLWRAIEQRIHALDIPQQIFTIDAFVTIYVAPGGSAWPANPLGGTPFDNLASALHWLGFYSITPNGYVTIQLATAFYYHATPIIFGHPNGDRVTIVGGDTATTLLYFTGGTNGLIVDTYLNALTNLTIFGVKAGGTTGLIVTGTCGIYSAIIQGWAVAATIQGTGFLNFLSLYLNDTTVTGMVVNQGGTVNGTTLNCLAIGYGTGAPFYSAGVQANAGGTVWLDSLTCNNCHKGADISGAGSELRVRAINVGTVEGPAAIEANDGAVIIASGGNPGDWHADAPGYFWANFWGFIRADNSFDATTKALASPPAGPSGTPVPGNINSMIWST